MSEAEEKGSPVCFGTYDPDDKACTRQCKLGTRCKAYAQKKGKPTAPIKEKLTPLTPESPDMSPSEWLMSLMKGKFKVVTSQEDGVTKHKLYSQDDKLQAVVKAASDGGYYMEGRKAKIQVTGLESVEHAGRIWQAFL